MLQVYTSETKLLNLNIEGGGLVKENKEKARVFIHDEDTNEFAEISDTVLMSVRIFIVESVSL